MTNMAMPLHNNSCLSGYEIYNSSRIYIGRHYYTKTLLDVAQE